VNRDKGTLSRSSLEKDLRAGDVCRAKDFLLSSGY